MLEKLQKKHDGYYIEEMYYDDKLSYLCEIIGICGCGNPYQTLVYVKKMFDRVIEKEFGSYDDDAYIFFVNWANEKNYMDHGISVLYSFLTDLGEELYKDMVTVIDELETESIGEDVNDKN